MKIYNGGSVTVIESKSEDLGLTSSCFEIKGFYKWLLILGAIGVFAHILILQEVPTSQTFMDYVKDTVVDFYGPAKSAGESLYHVLIIPFSATWITIPIVLGLIVMMISFHAVYMDSEKPGEIPPIPFSPTKDGGRGRNTISLNYTVAIVSGVMTFLVLFLDYEDLFTNN